MNRLYHDPDPGGDPHRSPSQPRGMTQGPKRGYNGAMSMRFDEAALNVLGEPLQDCSRDPVTGFYRNGCCETGGEDMGMHTVCAVMTAEFLAYSAAAGNDLSTPQPAYNFPGLKPGDRWCLCAPRWKEALDDGMAPPLVLACTHEETLAIVPLGVLKDFAVAE